MYDFIKGELVEITPTAAVIENNGIGYSLEISLRTYTDIRGFKETKLYIYHHLREDTELWYGFYTKEERTIFTMLIGVSGIGPNTARVILSSMTIEELRNAVITGDVNRIKSVKGIGLKSAQKVIIELKDKIAKGSASNNEAILQGFAEANQEKEEAVGALVLLGFAKTAAEKAVTAVQRENPESTLEELIKLSLKRL